MPSLPKPAFPAPKVPPSEWDLAELQKHLQTAVLLELHTIPLYLYSTYCVKPESKASAKIIRGIVIQEMLHLALAGNVMAATGGEPILYGPKYTPEYPCEMFYDPIELHLLPPSKDVVQEFVRVEEPIPPVDFPKGNVLPEYNSIGEFYKSLIEGVKDLDKKMSGKLFQPDTASRQFGPNDGIYGKDLTKITDLATASTALELIITQGEGSTEATVNDSSHWAKFKELEKLDIAYYPAVKDPKTANFKGKIKTAMLACDAAYSYLLLSIEKAWVPNKHRDDLVGNIMPLMSSVLGPCAEFLVTQQLDGQPEHAAPPFNYYPFSSTDAAYSELIKALEEASNNYPTLKDALDAAKDLFDISKINT